MRRMSSEMEGSDGGIRLCSHHPSIGKPLVPACPFTRAQRRVFAYTSARGDALDAEPLEISNKAERTETSGGATFAPRSFRHSSPRVQHTI